MVDERNKSCHFVNFEFPSSTGWANLMIGCDEFWLWRQLESCGIEKWGRKRVPISLSDISTYSSWLLSGVPPYVYLNFQAVTVPWMEEEMHRELYAWSSFMLIYFCPVVEVDGTLSGRKNGQREQAYPSEQHQKATITASLECSTIMSCFKDLSDFKNWKKRMNSELIFYQQFLNFCWELISDLQMLQPSQ